MEVRTIEFDKLRHAYITVKSFIEGEAFEDIESLNTRIDEDLGMAGDDNYELLVKFVEKFELSHEGFEYDKHFYSEGELFGSEAALINMLILPIWLPLKTIELLTFNKLKVPKPEFYKPDREVADMTFKDLLTWYLEGTYKTSSQITYQFSNNKEKLPNMT